MKVKMFMNVIFIKNSDFLFVEIALVHCFDWLTSPHPDGTALDCVDGKLGSER